MWIIYFLFIHGFFAIPSQAELKTEPQSYYTYRLDKLDSFGKLDLTELKGKKSIWILFQPECTSCEYQFNDLSCLNNTEQIAVGFWGSREKLKKVLRSSNFKGQKLMASKSLEKAVGLKLTPTILLVDQSGLLKKTILSKTPCDKLKVALENI
jgi:thioredoxin-related protein